MSVERFWVDDYFLRAKATLGFDGLPSTSQTVLVRASDYDAAMQQHEKVVGERNAALEELDQIDYICSASDIPEQRIVSRQGEPDLDFIPTVERVRQLKDALASKDAELAKCANLVAQEARAHGDTKAELAAVVRFVQRVAGDVDGDLLHGGIYNTVSSGRSRDERAAVRNVQMVSIG